MNVELLQIYYTDAVRSITVKWNWALVNTHDRCRNALPTIPHGEIGFPRWPDLNLDNPRFIAHTETNPQLDLRRQALDQNFNQ